MWLYIWSTFPAGVCAEGRHLARRHVPTTSTTSAEPGAQPGGQLQRRRGVCDGGHTLQEQRGNHTVHRQVYTSSFFCFYCSFLFWVWLACCLNCLIFILNFILLKVIKILMHVWMKCYILQGWFGAHHTGYCRLSNADWAQQDQLFVGYCWAGHRFISSCFHPQSAGERQLNFL